VHSRECGRRGFELKTLLFAALIVSSTAGIAKGQEIETSVDVGGHNLHFAIVQGKGTPILFEAGGGNDGTIWKNILKPLSEITGTTLIAYDRARFGNSPATNKPQSIVEEIESLETGLTKLGYQGEIVLVAHSLGGFYATVYATRHPKEVKAAVLIDANLICFYPEEYARSMQTSAKFKNTVETMRSISFPPDIPLIDLVAEVTVWEGTPDGERWKDCHEKFAEISPSRLEITAYKSGHYIFLANPELVIDAIVLAYANTVDKDQRSSLFERGFKHAFAAANEERKDAVSSAHSEDGLDGWGHSLLRKGQAVNAVEVFRLEVSLYPSSSNAYDSLGEGYEAIGDKSQAIVNYKRSLDLDPNTKHPKDRLKFLEAHDQ
jgi:tetratricopeptide (TPR) repeat protein